MSAPPDSYVVLAGEFRHEIEPVQSSRFIATVAPVADEDEAEALLERVRREGPKATHHCWAWRLGQPCDRFRFSDDGEPGGSAGRPMLQQLEGKGLSDTVAVVTRYFGGTKLGVGGLVRAYGGAVAKTLDLAPRRVHVVTRRLVVTCPYECTGPVQGLLAARGLEPAEASYGEAVVLTLDVPVSELERFERELRDRTAGRATVAN